MPHEKVYGYCENLCKVEVPDKASVDNDISEINNELDTKADLADLATVATSGIYNDLSNKPFIEQGTVNNINFTGLAKGRYVCSFAGGATGSPSNNDGVCITVINENTSYGAQTVISDGGHYHRKRNNGSWENWNTLETTSNKVTSIGSGSTDTQYPSAKAVYGMLNNLRTMTGTINDWKSAPNGATWYFYEGASSSLAPNPNCIIIVLKNSSSRGVAFAFGWAGGSTDKTIWKNTLHDSWKGWVSLHSN